MNGHSRPRGLVIAIDGPSGAGKSTVTRELARRIGYSQIDTGAMYRAVAWLLHVSGVDPLDYDAVERVCRDADIRLVSSPEGTHVVANGTDVTSLIRSPEMSLLTSRISTLAPVREAMVRAQRVMGRDGGVVLEGRDIGTVVFPDADLKFYLVASTEERARRRHAELVARGVAVSMEETIKDVVQRDTQDSERDLSPLRQAEDAILIDSSHMTFEEVLDCMARYFRESSMTGSDQ